MSENPSLGFGSMLKTFAYALVEFVFGKDTTVENAESSSNGKIKRTMEIAEEGDEQEQLVEHGKKKEKPVRIKKMSAKQCEKKEKKDIEMEKIPVAPKRNTETPRIDASRKRPAPADPIPSSRPKRVTRKPAKY